MALRINLHRDPRQIIEALNSAIAHCRERGLQHRHTELLGLLAMAHARNGQLPQSLAELDASLKIAASQQYLRTYLDEGQEVAALLRQMSAQPDRHPETMPLVRRLLRTFDRTAQQMVAKPGIAEGLLGELTRREVKLLKRLESGMSNKEIAESAFITEGTLKWH
ncbi:MAG: LuxR C-terminal-related transcriptional regulator [Stenotrophobium sp.]